MNSDKGTQPNPALAKVNEASSSLKDYDNVIFWGNSNEVNSLGQLDINDYDKVESKNQKMKGFDPIYRDFVDYIIKITHRIWEEKSIGLIYDTYHNNIVMHLGTKNAIGIQGVVSNTLQTLHSFPDRRLIGQNVIWSGFEKDGYLSSHRVQSTATNLGDSNFGPATGKKVNFRTVIDCAATNNRIHEEWLVRDNLWLVTQLGFNPDELAKQQAREELKHDSGVQKTFGLNESMDGQFMPRKYEAKNDFVPEMIIEMLNHVFNCKLIDEVTKYYWDNAVVHNICNQDLNGHNEIQGLLISFLSSIPNGKLAIERITINERQDGGHDVAVRWRFCGMNEGIGLFGAPSGMPLNIMGINHYHVKQKRIAEEWITYDGLDVLKQKYLGLLCIEEE